MPVSLQGFQKKKDYLICVDSDGCAMDTMNIKHIKCFGPCMVEEWGLQRWEKEILERWNEINLFTETRGINRFKGLAIALQEINEKYCPIDGIDELVEWVRKSTELSNKAVKIAESVLLVAEGKCSYNGVATWAEEAVCLRKRRTYGRTRCGRRRSGF